MNTVATIATRLRLKGNSLFLPLAALVSLTAAGATAREPVRMGMSANEPRWNEALAQVEHGGGKVMARRMFHPDLANSERTEFLVDQAAREIGAGRLPVISVKLKDASGRADWARAAQGAHDTLLADLGARLAKLPGRVVIAVHHEPYGDGKPSDYVAMQRHVLPILARGANVDSAVILNGWWWTAGKRALPDREIADWVPAELIAATDIVAVDTYQDGQTGRPGEGPAVKIERFSAWATRANAQRLGIGEYNALTGEDLTAAWQAIKGDPRYEFACVFNSNLNGRPGVAWQLEGDRLRAFRETLIEAANPD